MSAQGYKPETPTQPEINNTIDAALRRVGISEAIKSKYDYGTNLAESVVGPEPQSSGRGDGESEVERRLADREEYDLDTDETIIGECKQEFNIFEEKIDFDDSPLTGVGIEGRLSRGNSTVGDPGAEGHPYMIDAGDQKADIKATETAKMEVVGPDGSHKSELEKIYGLPIVYAKGRLTKYSTTAKRPDLPATSSTTTKPDTFGDDAAQATAEAAEAAGTADWSDPKYAYEDKILRDAGKTLNEVGDQNYKTAIANLSVQFRTPLGTFTLNARQIVPISAYGAKYTGPLLGGKDPYKVAGLGTDADKAAQAGRATQKLVRDNPVWQAYADVYK